MCDVSEEFKNKQHLTAVINTIRIHSFHTLTKSHLISFKYVFCEQIGFLKLHIFTGSLNYAQKLSND